MAGQFRSRFGGKRRDAILNVSETAVEAGKFGAQVDHFQVHHLRPRGPAIIFGRGYKASPEAMPSPFGVNSQEAKVSSLSAQLDVDAGDHSAAFFHDQKISRSQKRSHLFRICAIPVYKKALDAKGGVYQSCDGAGVIRLSHTEWP
jgi:hypothetical protein